MPIISLLNRIIDCSLDKMEDICQTTFTNTFSQVRTLFPILVLMIISVASSFCVVKHNVSVLISGNFQSKDLITMGCPIVERQSHDSFPFIGEIFIFIRSNFVFIYYLTLLKMLKTVKLTNN